MKLSIAWIFDHIDAPCQSVDMQTLVNKCIQTTAELEKWYKVSFDASSFTLAQVLKRIENGLIVKSSEWGKEVELPVRIDAVMGQWYLIKKNDSSYSWASMKDLGSTAKEHLIPALYCTESDCAGAWKKQVEAEDYVIELDNKSLNHRPDLWGHRGFAREVAAMFDLPLKPLDQFISECSIKQFGSDKTGKADGFALSNKAPQGCKRISGMYINQIEYRPSLIWMAHRLCRVDSRPIDAIVDATNYVMFDTSQPLHAFDAGKISNKLIEPRFARKKEKLLLLDGTILELNDQDLVITDGSKPLALAGIMGGAESGVSAATRSLFVESACFDATTIRLSAGRHKLRTEASTRFEKSLDPAQITIGIQRFARLLSDAQIPMQTNQEIIVLGEAPKNPVIELSHVFIEKRLGTSVQSNQIISVLEKLEFKVICKDDSYSVTVPTFRATKDIAIKEDIIEEIGRSIGYSTIEPKIPYVESKPSDLTPVMRLRLIKNVMAHALAMRELYTYAFFDEQFLHQLQWQPAADEVVSVLDPVSENWRRLVTSLIPHMINAVHQNVADYHALRFFEWGRIWHKSGKSVTEKKVLSGIIFDKKNIDFYSGKELLQRLFTALNLPVTWHSVERVEQPWFRQYQTADIMFENKKIGRAGSVNQLFLHPVAEGDAFVFELDGDFLLSFKRSTIQYKAASKYPDVIRDVSMLIPNKFTADEIINRITQTDEHITK